MNVKRVLFAFSICLIITVSAKSQQIAVDVFAGSSNYQGDMMDKRYSMQNSKFVFGFGASYILNGHIRIRGLISLAKVAANDKYASDPLLVGRNLNFTSSINELSATVHYDFLDLADYKITPYVFAGLAVFHFNPYTYDSSVGKVFLKPLSTEGQGMNAYPDRKPYSLTQLSIPFGGGIRFRVNDDIAIAWEVGLRKTNTDYLDDLSTNYVDQGALYSERGLLAVNLAYRGDELKDNPGIYPADGTVRGGPTKKDWYYFSGVTATFRINAGPDFKDSRKGSTACPKVF